MGKSEFNSTRALCKGINWVTTLAAPLKMESVSLYKQTVKIDLTLSFTAKTTFSTQTNKKTYTVKKNLI